MIPRRFVFFTLATLLALACMVINQQWNVKAADKVVIHLQPNSAPSLLPKQTARELHQRPSTMNKPGSTIEPYIRPEFARQMRGLRTTILEAAERHNRQNLSNMSDHDFAVVIAMILYNEHFGSLEEQVTPLRALTPFYEHLQVNANSSGVTNLSIWPANIRPSVALEILRQEVPLPPPTDVMTVPLVVAGSKVNVHAPISQTTLYAEITRELVDPKMSVEYLAANLERGLYRAQFEGVPVTWRALAAWHNQGIVSARDIRNNPTASSYVHRTSSYLPAARALIDAVPACYIMCADQR